MFNNSTQNSTANHAESAETSNSKKHAISFSSVSFFPYTRGFYWYAIYMLLLVTTVYFSLRYSAPLFSAILVFVSGFYLASTLSQPQKNQVTIDNDNIKIDNQLFSMKDFESYWIEPHGMNFGFLHIYQPKQLLANKEIPYLNIDTAILREFLSEILIDNQSSLSHSLAKISHILKI